MRGKKHTDPLYINLYRCGLLDDRVSRYLGQESWRSGRNQSDYLNSNSAFSWQSWWVSSTKLSDLYQMTPSIFCVPFWTINSSALVSQLGWACCMGHALAPLQGGIQNHCPEFSARNACLTPKQTALRSEVKLLIAWGKILTNSKKCFGKNAMSSGLDKSQSHKLRPN